MVERRSELYTRLGVDHYTNMSFSILLTDDMRFTLARTKSSEFHGFSCYVAATTANSSTTKAREYGRWVWEGM